jgi:predicted nucleotidyltransferase
MPVQEIHARSFTTAALLTRYQMPAAIQPRDVIRVLNKAKISFVLVGAYGLAGWIKDPRATKDVDVVVAARHVKKAVKVLVEAFPEVESVELPVVVRLRERGTENVVIDVMKPVQQPYLEVFKHTHKVVSGGQTYRVPSLEMAIVMKFSAMTSLYRAADDKHQDAHDFIRMVKNNPDLDREKLAELASHLYREGSKDILEMVRQALAGEVLKL